MSRPFKCRRIGYVPNITYFKPAGIPMRDLEEVSLSFEEAEAIRLKDLEGLEQEQAAESMNISRTTFQRMLGSARQKIADALLNGKAIRIEGGNFEILARRFKCVNEHEWNVSSEILEKGLPIICPVCNTSEISRVSLPETIFAQRGRCCRRRSEWRTGTYSAEEGTIIRQTEGGENMLQTETGK